MSFLERIFSGQASPDDLLLIGIPLLGLLLVIFVLLLDDGTERQFARRMRRVKTGHAGPETGPSQVVNIRRVTRDSSNLVIDQLIKRLVPQPEKLRLRLARAGLSPALGPYLTSCLAIASAISIGMLFVPVIPKPAAALIGIVAGLGLPHMFVGILGARRKKKFIENFPEAIDLMVRGLKSGLPITESIKAAAEEIEDPVGSEFQRVIDSVRMGANLDDALHETNKRMDVQEFNFLTVAMSIQSETGGNLAETLENLSNVLRSRRQLKLKIKALSSEAKASAYIIGSLPFVMALLLYLVNPGYIMGLIEDSRGHIMIALGLTSFTIGTGVMYKMVKFEI